MFQRGFSPYVYLAFILIFFIATLGFMLIPSLLQTDVVSSERSLEDTVRALETFCTKANVRPLSCSYTDTEVRVLVTGDFAEVDSLYFMFLPDQEFSEAVRLSPLGRLVAFLPLLGQLRLSPNENQFTFSRRILTDVSSVEVRATSSELGRCGASSVVISCSALSSISNEGSSDSNRGGGGSGSGGNGAEGGSASLCNDGKDNDGDTLIDLADPGCGNAEDNDENDSDLQKTSALTQYGITWTFAEEEVYGRFANGDYWVVGPVTITTLSPDFDGTHNGWTVNYRTDKQQPFDLRAGPLFNASLVPDLPYTAQPGESILKSISREPFDDMSCRPCLQTAAVLTVVDAIPENAGSTVLRPPYFGEEKPFYSLLNLDMDVLPQLTPPPHYNVGSFTWIADRFKRVQLDIDSYPGEDIRPYDNYLRSEGYRGYGGRVAVDNGDFALRLMLNDSFEEKLPDLIYYLQMGIDLYSVMEQGGTWQPNGGHGSGRKTPIILTSLILADSEMQMALRDVPKMTFQEDGFLTFHQQANNGAGTVLFGEGTAWYWRALATDSASRTDADPYGYIDGGVVPGTSYQKGINSLIWKGPVLVNQLVPEAKTVWNNELFEMYVNRWVNLGAWARPDICAPVMGYCVGGTDEGSVCTYADLGACPEGYCAGGQCNGGTYDGQLCGIGHGPSPNDDCAEVRCERLIPEFYKVTYGEDPNNQSTCIIDSDPDDGLGRFPYRHGMDNNTGGAGYISEFTEAMWGVYRVGPPQCQDFLDNDYDGVMDYPLDSGCTSFDDTDESITGPV